MDVRSETSWLMNFFLRWTLNRHLYVIRNSYNNSFYVETYSGLLALVLKYNTTNSQLQIILQIKCVFCLCVYPTSSQYRTSQEANREHRIVRLELGIIAVVDQPIMIIMLITNCELSCIDARPLIVELLKLRKF